jgi:hypothetical protein
MVPTTGSATTKPRLVERLAIGVLIGVVAVSVGGAALLMVYLNRIGDAAGDLNRVQALGAYDGRPAPVVVDGVNAMNYLLMTADDSGRLQAVLIAHLSASRRDLTLVALPADLLVDGGATADTLASAYAADPLRTARAVESLTGARMDHQLLLRLHGFAAVVDTLGGIDLDGGRLSGPEVVSRLASAPDGLTRSVWTADLLRSSLSRANLSVAIADPNRFDKVMDALTPCLTVDAELSGDEIRATMVESRVRADRMQTWPLAAVPAGAGLRPEEGSLAALRSALATDSFPRTMPQTVPGAAPSTPHTSVAGASTPRVVPGASMAATPDATIGTPDPPRVDVAPTASARR